MNVVTKLRAQIAKMTMDLNKTTWRSFRTNDRSDNPKAVIVRSSIIQDIDQDKLSNVDVKCFFGANTYFYMRIYASSQEIKHMTWSLSWLEEMTVLIVLILQPSWKASRNWWKQLFLKQTQLQSNIICPQGNQSTHNCIVFTWRTRTRIR